MGKTLGKTLEKHETRKNSQLAIYLGSAEDTNQLPDTTLGKKQ